MKIGIIASSLADLHIFHILRNYAHNYVIFLDTRFGSWGQLSRDDGIERVRLALAHDSMSGCDAYILPPIYELAALQDPSLCAEAHIIPMFHNYITHHVLPYSVVGKIGLVGYEAHQGQLAAYRHQIIAHHHHTNHQTKNKHFQRVFPLYTLKTDHWNMLYDLPRSRFVNKLLKTDLKKLKDYGIDTLLSLEYGYFKHQKTILGTFHKKVRFHGLEKLQLTIDDLIKDNQSGFGCTVFVTGAFDVSYVKKKLGNDVVVNSII